MSRNNTIVIPYGWRRLINTSSSPPAATVTYISPSGDILSSTVEVCQYLEKDDTCKCGLQCPIHVPKVFSFNPEVRSVNLPKREWNRLKNTTESHKKNCQHWNKLHKAQIGKKKASCHPELSMEPAPKLLIIRKDGKLRSVIPDRTLAASTVKKVAGSAAANVKLPVGGSLPARKGAAVSPLKSPLFEPGPSAAADSEKQLNSKKDFKLQWIKADDDAAQNDAESENDELCFSPDFKKSPPMSFPQPLMSGLASALFKPGQFGTDQSQPRAATFMQSSASGLPSRHTGIEPVHRFGMSSFPGSNFVMKGDVGFGTNSSQNMYLQDTQRFPLMSVKSEQASQLNQPSLFGVAPNVGTNRQIGFPGSQDPSAMVWQQNQGSFIAGNQKQSHGKCLMKTPGNYLPKGQRPPLRSPTGQAALQRFPMGSPTMLNPTSPYGFQTVNMGQSAAPLASPGGTNPSPFSNRSHSRSSSVGTPAPSPGGPWQGVRPVHLADGSRPLSRSSNVTTPVPEASSGNISQWNINSANVGSIPPRTPSAVGGFTPNLSPGPTSPYLPQRFPQSSSMVRFTQDASKVLQTDMSPYGHPQSRIASEQLRLHSQSYQQQNQHFENPGGVQYHPPPTPFNPPTNSQYASSMALQGGQQPFSQSFESNMFRPCSPCRPGKMQFARINEPVSNSLPRFPFTPAQPQMPSMQHHQGAMVNQRFMTNPHQWRPFSGGMAAMRPGQYYPPRALPPGMPTPGVTMGHIRTPKPKRVRKKKASKSSMAKAQQQPAQQHVLNTESLTAATEFPDFLFPVQTPTLVHGSSSQPTVLSSRISSDVSSHRQRLGSPRPVLVSQARLPTPSLVMPAAVTIPHSSASDLINAPEEMSTSQPCKTTIASTIEGKMSPLPHIPNSSSSVGEDSGSGVTTPPPLPVLSPTQLFDEPSTEDDFSDFAGTNPGVFEFPVDAGVAALSNQMLPAISATSAIVQTLDDRLLPSANTGATVMASINGSLSLAFSVVSTVKQASTIAPSVKTEVASHHGTSETSHTLVPSVQPELFTGLYSVKYPLSQRQKRRPDITSLVSSTGKVFHMPAKSTESVSRRFSADVTERSQDTRRRYKSDPYPVATPRDSTNVVSRRHSSNSHNCPDVEQGFERLCTFHKLSTSSQISFQLVCTTSSEDSQAQALEEAAAVSQPLSQQTSARVEDIQMTVSEKRPECTIPQTSCSAQNEMASAVSKHDNFLEVSVSEKCESLHVVDPIKKISDPGVLAVDGRVQRTTDEDTATLNLTAVDADSATHKIEDGSEGASVPGESRGGEMAASAEKLEEEDDASAVGLPNSKTENDPESKAEANIMADKESADTLPGLLDVQSTTSNAKSHVQSELVASALPQTPKDSSEEGVLETDADCVMPAEGELSPAQSCPAEALNDGTQLDCAAKISDELDEGENTRAAFGTNVPEEGSSVQENSGSSCGDDIIPSENDLSAGDRNTGANEDLSSGDVGTVVNATDDAANACDERDIISDDAPCEKGDASHRIKQEVTIDDQLSETIALSDSNGSSHSSPDKRPKNAEKREGADQFSEAVALSDSNDRSCPLSDERSKNVEKREGAEAVTPPVLSHQQVATSATDAITFEADKISNTYSNRETAGKIENKANAELAESSHQITSLGKEEKDCEMELQDNQTCIEEMTDSNNTVTGKDKNKFLMQHAKADTQQSSIEPDKVEDALIAAISPPGEMALKESSENVKLQDEEASSDGDALSLTEQKIFTNVSVAQGRDDVCINKAPASQQEISSKCDSDLLNGDKVSFLASATDMETAPPLERCAEYQNEMAKVESQPTLTHHSVSCLGHASETTDELSAEIDNEEQDEENTDGKRDSADSNQLEERADIPDVESSSSAFDALEETPATPVCSMRDSRNKVKSEDVELAPSASSVVDGEQPERPVEESKTSPRELGTGEDAELNSAERHSVAPESKNSSPKTSAQANEMAVLEDAPTEKEAETNLPLQDSQTVVDAAGQKSPQAAVIASVATSDGTLSISSELTSTVIRQLSNYNTILKNLLTRQVAPGGLAQLTSAGASSATDDQQSEVISALIASAAPQINRLFKENGAPSGLATPVTSTQSAATESTEGNSAAGIVAVTQAEITGSNTQREVDPPAASLKQTPKPRFTAEMVETADVSIVSESHSADSSQTTSEREGVQPSTNPGTVSSAHQGLQVPIVSSSVRGTNSDDREEEELGGATLRSSAAIARGNQPAVQSEVSTSVQQNPTLTRDAPLPIANEVKTVPEKRRGRPRNAANRQGLKRHAAGDLASDKPPKRLSAAASSSNARGSHRGSNASDRQTKIVKNGDLIWGQMRGFPSWPGRVVKPSEVRGLQQRAPLSEGKVWVKWFGDHTFTQMNPADLVTMTEGLEAHHRSRKKGRTRTRKISIHLEKAIQEAVDELEQQQGSVKKISVVPGTSSVVPTVAYSGPQEKPRRGRKRKTT